MISIYTRSNNPFKIEFWKWVAKKILRKYSGPDAVLDSLKRGLTELQIPFEINPIKPKYNIIHVISGVEILKSVIRNKKKGEIVVAGPNIIQIPLDYNQIITDSKIDAVITPSKWVSDFYISLIPLFKDKIYSWPAGVQIPKIISDMTGKTIIIKKDISELVFKQVITTLERKGFLHEVLEYGNFSHIEYLEKLTVTPLVIYLQKSESQGLALQEAWAYNVPTLVYRNTEWSDGKYSWSDPKISAPYLSDETGLFFTPDTFEEGLVKIRDSRQINPQNYCENNLSDIKSVQAFLNIIKKYEKNN